MKTLVNAYCSNAPTPLQPQPCQTQKQNQTTASGLKYADVKEGSGDVATAGKTVSVHYTGWLTNGTKFDSSKDRGQPFEFPLGGGRVIKGWDEGVQGMKVGGVRKLTIPASLGYGSRGAVVDSADSTRSSKSSCESQVTPAARPFCRRRDRASLVRTERSRRVSHPRNLGRAGGLNATGGASRSS